MAFMNLNAFAISKENERMAKRVINEYYRLLQEYADSPNNPKKQQAIANLFTDSNGDAVWVKNDILLLKSDSEKEDNLRYYLSCIDGLWNRENKKIHFNFIIDEKSMKEQSVEIKDKNNPIKFTNVWVWVDKTITADGRNPIKTKETFKIVDGKIEAITSPEMASYRINGIDLFNRKKYKEAFEVFQKNINEGRATPTEYMCASFILLTHKKLYPKTVKDVLAIHYAAKANHIYYMNMVLNNWIYPYLKCYDNNKILDSKYKYYRKYFNESREWSYNHPISHGVIRRGITGDYSSSFVYSDMNGEIVFEDSDNSFFEEAHRFTKEGVALVKTSTRYHLIDTTGRIISNNYEDAVPLHTSENSQLIAVGKSYWSWGYINYKGEEVIPFVYDIASNFCNGIALVTKDNAYWFINEKGEIVDGKITLPGVNINEYHSVSTMSKDVFDLMKMKDLPSITVLYLRLEEKIQNKELIRKFSYD